MIPSSRGLPGRPRWAAMVSLAVLLVGGVWLGFRGLLLRDGLREISDSDSAGEPPFFDSDSIRSEGRGAMPYLASDGAVVAAPLAWHSVDYSVKRLHSLALWIDPPHGEPTTIRDFVVARRDRLRGAAPLAVEEVAERGAPGSGRLEAIVIGVAEGSSLVRARVPLDPPGPAFAIEALDEGRSWMAVKEVIALAAGDGGIELVLFVQDWGVPHPPLRAMRLALRRVDGTWRIGAPRDVELPSPVNAVFSLATCEHDLPREVFVLATGEHGLSVLRFRAGEVEDVREHSFVPIDGHRARVRAVPAEARVRERAYSFWREIEDPTRAALFPRFRERMEDGLSVALLELEDDEIPPWIAVARPHGFSLGSLDAALHARPIDEGGRAADVDGTPWLQTRDGATRILFLESYSWLRPDAPRRWVPVKELRSDP